MAFLNSVVNGANGAVQGLNWFNFRPFLTNQLVRGLNWFKPIVNWLTNSLPSFPSEPIKEVPRYDKRLVSFPPNTQVQIGNPRSEKGEELAIFR